jgi:hypothetical protein
MVWARMGSYTQRTCCNSSMVIPERHTMAIPLPLGGDDAVPVPMLTRAVSCAHAAGVAAAVMGCRGGLCGIGRGPCTCAAIGKGGGAIMPPATTACPPAIIICAVAIVGCHCWYVAKLFTAAGTVAASRDEGKRFCTS